MKNHLCRSLWIAWKRRAWPRSAQSYEIVLINDGSRDATSALIRSLGHDPSDIVAIDLMRNHGHQLAVSAGLAQARGQRVLIIDADLQDPPELLGDMMRAMDEGADVVFGRRRSRASESHVKRITAHVFYRLLARLSEVEIPVDPGTSVDVASHGRPPGRNA